MSEQECVVEKEERSSVEMDTNPPSLGRETPKEQHEEEESDESLIDDQNDGQETPRTRLSNEQMRREVLVAKEEVARLFAGEEWSDGSDDSD